MKKLFCILLVVNVLFWGLVKLYQNQTPIDWKARETNADQVRVVTGQRTSSASASASAPVAEQAIETAHAASTPATVASAVALSSKPSAVCRRLAGITPDILPNTRSRIKSAQLKAEEIITGETRFWVYIPPLASPDAARKKVEELEGLGIDDFYAINNGSKWQNAVSLGVFSSREAGEKRLADLKAKGVRSAQLRDKEDTPRPATFVFKSLKPDELEKLEKISKQLRGAQLMAITCPDHG